MTTNSYTNDESKDASLLGYFALYLRIALGAAFLSAVADRFGIWGALGDDNVYWGNFQSFSEYTALLNPYCPAALIPALSWGVTIAEIVLGIGLILGIYLRKMAIASGVLLFCFTLGLIAGVGFKPTLDFSVYTGSAASLLLAFQTTSRYSIDAVLVRRKSTRSNDSTN